MITRRSATRIGAALVAFASLAACGEERSDGSAASGKTLSGYELTPAPSVAEYSLPDASASDADFPLKAPTGHLLVVYFGYMSCPDVCPTTLAELKKALGLLGDTATRVDVAMGTIDPGRDTGANLTKYVQSFVPTAHALRTDDQTVLEATTHAFGASYSVTTKPDGAIEVGHSASMYVVDATGTIVLTWPYGIKAASLADDIRILLGRGVA